MGRRGKDHLPAASRVMSLIDQDHPTGRKWGVSRLCGAAPGQPVGKPGPMPHGMVLLGGPEVVRAGVSTSVRGTGAPELLERVFTTEAVPLSPPGRWRQLVVWGDKVAPGRAVYGASSQSCSVGAAGSSGKARKLGIRYCNP